MKNLKNIFQPYKQLPKSIYIIFFSSLINNLGNFVSPLLTLILIYTTNMHIETIGIIVAINSFVGLISSIFGGKLIDIVGRKKIFILFRTLSATCLLLCIFTKNSIILTSLLVISNFFSGFSLPVYNTIITDLTKGDQRNLAFSLQYMALNIGFSIGPLLAGLLYPNYIVFIFGGDALTTFFSIILVAFFIPETIPNEENLEIIDNTPEKAEKGTLFQLLIKRPILLFFSLIIIIYFIVFSQFNFGLPLQLSNIFQEKSATLFGILMTINAIICSIFPMFINTITKKFKPSFNIAIGGILYAIGFGMLFFINSFFLFIVSVILWTIGEILVSYNTNVFIAAQAPISHRGRFNSILPIIRKFGFTIGPILSGLYLKYTTIRNLWILMGIISLIGSILMYKLYLLDTKNNHLI